MLAQQTAQAHAGREFRGGTAGLQSLSARVSLVAAGLPTACPTAGRSAGPPHPVRRAKVTDVLLKAPAIFSRIDDCPCPWPGMEWSMRASCTVGFVGYLASGMREAHFAYRISAIAIVEQSDKSDNGAKRLRPERNHG
jgi:hypothetical protein